ncbi:MAG: RNA polymerase sigma-70 factor [Parapedobacter sp.]|nr:MAG: RNA polymerase sigma-70 factor [Parapedobacter sp.]
MPLISKLEEREKLLELKAGKHAAFNYFYQQYKVPLYANIWKLTKSHDLAAELLQEVFVKVWQKRELTNIEEDFRAYLYTIAKHTVYDFFRKAARERKLGERLIAAGMAAAQEGNAVEEAISFRESKQLLQDCITELPPKCGLVFRLCKLEGKSYEEVAAALGISTATVNNHIVKATRILKSRLAYEGIMLLLITAFLVA